MTAPAAHRLGALPGIGAAVVVIGVFDGVHRGHAALLARTVSAALPLGGASVALVLDPHPGEVVGSGGPIERLTSPRRTLELIERAGIDAPLALRFDREVAGLSPEAFIGGLAPGIELRALVMTEESRFGRARAGTPERAAQIGALRAFDVVLCPLLASRGEVISSSRIRRLVRAGELTAASELLGRPHELEGTPAPFADGTATGSAAWRLRLDYPPALPPPGRYRAMVEAGAEEHARGMPVEVLLGGDDDARNARNTVLVEGEVPAVGASVRLQFIDRA